MSKNTINCLSLNEFNDRVEMYLESWLSNSKFSTRSEMSEHGIYVIHVVDVHNTAVVYRYTFTYDDYLKTMAYTTEIAHFEKVGTMV